MCLPHYNPEYTSPEHIVLISTHNYARFLIVVAGVEPVQVTTVKSLLQNRTTRARYQTRSPCHSAILDQLPKMKFLLTASIVNCCKPGTPA